MIFVQGVFAKYLFGGNCEVNTEKKSKSSELYIYMQIYLEVSSVSYHEYVCIGLQ